MTVASDDVDAFLDSITLPIEQPIIQRDLELSQAMATGPSNEPCQRKSTRLAQKAPLNVGKDPFQVAHDLLVKKLGELALEEPALDQPDFEFYAQHFERPINKDKMEAIQTLIEQGCKKQKKSNSSKKMQVGLGASLGVQL